jgi:phage gp45-like
LAAGPASVQGRVVTADGRGIKSAMIVVSGGNLSEPRIVITNTFGFYRVPDLESGESYVFTVFAKKYQFRENSIFVSLHEDLHGLDFIADQ